MAPGISPGARIVALLLGSPFVSPLAAPAQDSPDSAPASDQRRVQLEGLTEVEASDDEIVYACVGPVTVILGDLEMRADRALLWSMVPRGPTSSGGDPLHAGPRVPPPAGSVALDAVRTRLSARANPILDQLREIYLEGNVFWRRGADTAVFADRLYYDFVEEHGVIEEGRLIAEQTRERRARPGRPREDRVYSLQVRAEEIRMRGLSGLDVVDGEFSTCTFGEPHFHVRTGELSIDFEPDAEDPAAPGTVRVRSRDNQLRVGRTPVLPLPPFSFRADVDEGLPLKRIRAGRSSKLGAFLQTEWAWDIQKAGDRVHEWLGLGEAFDGKFELALDGMSRRGPGIGPGFEYRAPDRYFGEIGSYFVVDREDEDRGRLSRPQVGGEGDPFRYDVDHPLRGRVFTRNRFFLGGPWSLDLESHWLTDEGFQNEFLEQEAKEAKEPESYLHLVRRSGTTRLRALYRNRLNDFDTQLDSLPRLSFDQVGQALFPVPFAGDHGGYILLDQYHEVGQFRRHPADDVALTSASLARADSVFELSSPVDLGPLGLSPFANARFTGYDESVADGPSLGRFATTAGGRAQLPFHRDFDVFCPTFNIDGLRHVVVLDAGYENTWSSSRSPREFEQLDAVDAVDEFARYLVGLRQRFQTWRGPRVEDFLQVDAELPLYPDEDRDNPVRTDTQGAPVGRTAGPLRFDVLYAPGFTFGALAGTRLFTEGEWDLTDRRLDVLNTGVAVRPRPDLWSTLSYRVARSRPGVRGSRVLTASSDLRLTEKWSVGVLVQHDLRAERVLEQRLNLRRHGHDFLVDIEFERDEGENNTSFTINLRPILFRAKDRDRSLYERGNNPGLADDFDLW